MKPQQQLFFTEVLVLVLIAAGIFGSMQIMELRAEEPRRAIVAMEMMLGKNYIVPKIFAVNYYNKPPLFNWLLVAIFKLTGSFSEVWVRLPSILSLFVTAYLIYKIVKQHINKQAGFIAAVLLLVSADIFFYGAVDAGEIDLFLMLVMCSQALAIYYYSLRQKWWQAFMLSYLLMAAGILTKGLPLVVIQGLLLLCWLTYIKQFKKLFSIQHIVSLVIGVAVVFVYFLQYSKQQNVLLYLAQLLTESTQRSALTNKWSSIALNILQAPLQVFYICIPATAILLYACNRNVREQLKGDKLFAFSFMFTLIISVIFFLSPQTANRYLYPAFPFIAIMAALVYAKAQPVLAASKWLISYRGLLWVFIFFTVVRIGYNVWGIPYQLKTFPLNYPTLTAKILQYTHDSAVYLTGYPQKYDVNSFLFIKPAEDSINGAPLIPYQIPYYLTRATHTIMRYDSIPQKGLYYLTPVDFLKNKPHTVYFTFFDSWIRRDLALVKF